MSFPPEIYQQMLSDRYDGTTLTIILCDETLETHTFDFTAIDTSTDVITVSNNFVEGSRVQLTTTGTLSSDIAAGQVLYVTNPTGSTLQLATTYEGTPINWSNQGTGTYSITELSVTNPVVSGIRYPVRTVADVVRHETNYQGIPARPQVTGDAATLGIDPLTGGTQPDVARITLLPTCDNSGGAAPCEFNFAAVITGGSTTPSSTTGTLELIVPFSSLASIAAGTSQQPTLIGSIK